MESGASPLLESHVERLLEGGQHTVDDVGVGSQLLNSGNAIGIHGDQAHLALFLEAEVCRQLNINWITFNQWQQRAMEGMLQALENRVNLSKGEALSPRLQALLQNRQRSVTATKLTSRLEQINKLASPPSLPAKTE